MHQSSMEKMTAFRDRYLSAKIYESLHILDLGSQDVNGSYRSLFSELLWDYTGLDMAPGDNVDIVLNDPYHWKEFKSNSVDVLISGQAFEHIQYIWISILEVARVLKPGGFGCIVVPSSGVEHRYPFDCWRIYPDGLIALANWAELNVCESTTQWESEGYDDGSDEWHDSMLIFQKPISGTFGGLRGRFRLWLRHKVVLMGLGNK